MSDRSFDLGQSTLAGFFSSALAASGLPDKFAASAVEPRSGLQLTALEGAAAGPIALR
jgi:hypothetical protein